jgi:hypothetical protein
MTLGSKSKLKPLFSATETRVIWYDYLLRNIWKESGWGTQYGQFVFERVLSVVSQYHIFMTSKWLIRESGRDKKVTRCQEHWDRKFGTGKYHPRRPQCLQEAARAWKRLKVDMLSFWVELKVTKSRMFRVWVTNRVTKLWVTSEKCSRSQDPDLLSWVSSYWSAVLCLFALIHSNDTIEYIPTS